MKFTFRVTLLSILLGMLAATIAVLGASSYLNARFAAADLGQQILDQTSLRVEQEITRLLRQAVTTSELSQQMMQSDQLPHDEFVRLVDYWKHAMSVSRQLTSMYVGVEATGESTGVSRLKEGRLTVWESRRDPASGAFQYLEYWADDYPQKPFNAQPKPAPDIRTRPWYLLAKQHNQAAWTESFVFLGLEGVENVHGLTYATPVHAADGALLAVLDADFDLGNLCRFFDELRVAKSGFAFVVELRADGTQAVIAHPDATLMTRPVAGVAAGTANELTPLADFADRRVPEFMAQVGPIAVTSTPRLHPVQFEHAGQSYLGTCHALRGEGMPHWLICTVVPEDDILADVQQHNYVALLVGLTAALTAVLVSLYVSRQVAQPLVRLADEAERIGRMQIDRQPVLHSVVAEVDRLAAAIEDMKTGLRSFQKYVPSDVVRALIAQRAEATLGGERRVATILFCDIVDFTAHAERLPPEQLVEQLRDYFTVLAHEISAAGGVVDKYIGDAVMAVWNAPAPCAEHAAGACLAACRIDARLVELQARWRAAGQSEFYSRIGVNTGEVIAGNIGSEQRLNYTVVGDAVNLASRLESLNRHYGTRIIIAQTTAEAAGSTIVTRPLDWVSVKGKTAPVLIHELLGMRADLEGQDYAWAETYAEALTHFRRREWSAATAALEAILDRRPNDYAATQLQARCREHQHTPPPDDWDGVRSMREK